MEIAPGLNAPHPPWLQESQRLSQRIDDFFHHLLGVAEQHHGVAAVEQRVVGAGLARGKRAFGEHQGAGLP